MVVGSDTFVLYLSILLRMGIPSLISKSLKKHIAYIHVDFHNLSNRCHIPNDFVQTDLSKLHSFRTISSPCYSYFTTFLYVQSVFQPSNDHQKKILFLQLYASKTILQHHQIDLSST